MVTTAPFPDTPIASAEPDSATCNEESDWFGGGSGTEEAPYVVATAAHLAAITEKNEVLDCHFRQVADIDLSEVVDFTPIGSMETPFTGVYEGAVGLGGDAATIDSLEIDDTDGHDFAGVGLFGFVRDATINNLELTGFEITTTGNGAGALFGVAEGAAISNITVYGVSITANTGVGALGGAAQDSTFADIEAHTSRVTANASNESMGGAGGVLGGVASMYGTMTMSRVSVSNVTVESGSSPSGGLVGATYFFDHDIGISNVSVAGGSVSGDTRVGGLIGFALTMNPYDSNMVLDGVEEGEMLVQIRDNIVEDLEVVSAFGPVGGLVGHVDGREIIIADSHVTGGTTVTVGDVDSEPFGLHKQAPPRESGGLIGAAWARPGGGLSVHRTSADAVVTSDVLDGSPIGAGGLIGVLMAEGDTRIDVSESFSTGEVVATGIRTEVHLGGLIGKILAEAGSAISVSESFSTGEVSFRQPTLEGRMIDSDILELSDIGMILGTLHVGGLVGTAQVGAMGDAATIEFSDVFSTVEIEITTRTDGDDISAGGLIGAAIADGEVNLVSITNAYAAGAFDITVDDTPIDVNTADPAGGFDLSIDDPIVGEIAEGGLVGSVVEETEGTVSAEASFWDATVSGLTTDPLMTTGPTDPGSLGLSTTAMQSFATFDGADWEIITRAQATVEAVWGICDESTYPFLLWFRSVQTCPVAPAPPTPPPPPPPPPPPAPAPTQERFGGADRYETAVKVSQEFFPDGADLVYLASGHAFPDGLVAGSYAALDRGPVLLVRPDRIPPVVVEELARLQPAGIVIVGGPAAISTDVEDHARYFDAFVIRIYGPDRYGTAVELSRARHSAGLLSVQAGQRTVYIASGQDFADGLVAGPIATLEDAPVLLVRRDSLPAVTAAELIRLRPDRIVIIGGAAAVSTAVRVELADYAPIVERLFGPNRYSTSVALSESRFEPGVPAVFLATGENFADALSTASPAGILESPVLLTRNACVPAVVRAELERLEPERIIAVGNGIDITTDCSPRP